MTLVEHTPQRDHSKRETEEYPLSQKLPQNPESSPPQEKENETEKTRVTTTIHTREVHLYTVPNRGQDHFPSDLNREIIHNPAPYMGSADF